MTNFTPAAIKILIEKKGEEMAGGAAAGHQDPGPTASPLPQVQDMQSPQYSVVASRGCQPLAEGPQILNGLGLGLVEAEMAWASSQGPWWSVVRGAGLEESPLPSGSPRPMLPCYPTAESHVLTEDTFRPIGQPPASEPRGSCCSGGYPLL